MEVSCADPDEFPATRAKPWMALWRTALGCSGWLLVIPLLRLTQTPPILGLYLALPIWVACFLFATAVSITAI